MNTWVYRTQEYSTGAGLQMLAGEMCIETDTGKYKIGDGTTAWNELDYVNNSLGHETWTMTLDDDSVITKEVATWTSQG